MSSISNGQPTIKDVFEILQTYQDVYFRASLRPTTNRELLLHTLVVDAIPSIFMTDKEHSRNYYQPKLFYYTYPSATFVAAHTHGKEIVEWLGRQEMFIQMSENDTEAVSGNIPELFSIPTVHPMYYIQAAHDTFGPLRWPHTVYVFQPSTSSSEPIDYRRLIADNCPSFRNFQVALGSLIFDEPDWEKAERLSFDSRIVVRIVQGGPYFANIYQNEQDKLVVDIKGIFKSNAHLVLSGSGSVDEKMTIMCPDSYTFATVPQVPKQGNITLAQGSKLFDEYEWSAYNPIRKSGSPTSKSESFPVLTGYTDEEPDSIGQLVENDGIPPAIRDSLTKFRVDHPASQSTGFIMMRFASTKAHSAIAKTIKDTLSQYGLEGLRADDKEYHDELYPNIQTYLYGCSFGIAVFERIEKDEFNPNVALEVGYMLALGKPVCFLKDKTITVLHADLGGKLYKPFDLQNIAGTIPTVLKKWLADNGIVSG